MMRHSSFISSFKRIVLCLLMLVLLGVCFFSVQTVVKAKFMGDSTTIVNGFYAEKENTIDVVLIGSSNCFCTIDPMVLYEEYGITAYDFASSSQPMNVSLLYAKEAMKTQKPKVVALEVNCLIGMELDNLPENSLRWGLTDIPFSLAKMKCLSQANIKFGSEYVSYLFPVFRYHERWKEVSKNDFVYAFEKNRENYSKGYLRTTEVSPEPVILSDFVQEGESWAGEGVLACLDELVALCQENGVELVLFKSPRAGWYSYQSALVEELANERGLLFVDYQTKIDDSSLDATTDFRDTEHLNHNGAYKVSKDFGAFLKTNFDLADRREEGIYDSAVVYYDRLESQPFAEAATLMECYEMVSAEPDYLLIMTYQGGINAETGETVSPHHWVYVDGKLCMEEEWTQSGVRLKDIDGVQVTLRQTGNIAQVFINNLPYAVTANNWTVIVYDKITEQVVATLGFDA